jgi:hypothetical protein
MHCPVCWQWSIQWNALKSQKGALARNDTSTGIGHVLSGIVGWQLMTSTMRIVHVLLNHIQYIAREWCSGVARGHQHQGARAPLGRRAKNDIRVPLLFFPLFQLFLVFAVLVNIWLFCRQRSVQWYMLSNVQKGASRGTIPVLVSEHVLSSIVGWHLVTSIMRIVYV